ncbi:hypothetical protein, partial [Glycomyces dulcitolivorans]|uniref:hypothetical protein n=1 Tax=Glycomyces dulcitolivorans TaxID=2200759 RepID=UPI001E4E0EFF
MRRNRADPGPPASAQRTAVPHKPPFPATCNPPNARSTMSITDRTTVSRRAVIAAAPVAAAGAAVG